LNSLVNDTGEHVHIALSATKSDLWLDELDAALDEQVLQQVSVLLLIVDEALGHLYTSLSLQTLDELVGTLHASDTRFVLCLGPLDLKVALRNLQVLEHLVAQALLLGLDHFLRLHGKVGLHLLSDVVDALTSLLLNELDHASHD